MKRILAAVFTLSTLTVGASASDFHERSIVDVPFEFMANGKTVPAGRVYIDMFPTAVRLMSSDRRAVMIPLRPLRDGKGFPKSRLVFIRTDGVATLAAVQERISGEMRAVAER